MNVVESHKNYDPRLRIFYLLAAAIVLLLLGGLARLQLFHSDTYSEKEKQQNQRRILIPGPRGNIYDRENRLLVGNLPRFSTVIFLAELRREFRIEYLNLVRTYRETGSFRNDRAPCRACSEVEVEARAAVVQRYLDEINEAIGENHQVDPQELDQHYHRRLLLPFPLLSDLDQESFAKILEQIPIDSKIQVHTSNSRYYPHDSAGAHLIGYVSSTTELPTTDLPGANLMTFNLPGSIGRTGLEHFFNDHLHGKTGSEIWVVDPSGFRYGEPVQSHLPVKGEDLVTSIDVDLQKIAERAIGVRTGALAMLDVQTGEVLALASKPDYNLNDLSPYIPRTVFQQIEEEGGWLNRATQGVYPPGSTFKLITAMAALRAGTITPKTTSYCTGRFQVGNSSFPCHRRSGHGEIDLAEALRVSCNVFFYEHSQTTGIEAIAAEARRFGLSEKTGIELPSETGRMLVPDRDYKRRVHNQAWFPGDTANVSIGQGFLQVTPLQMATFTASLARGETRTTPTLLRHDKGLKRHQNSESIGLSRSEIEAIFSGMAAAAESGTARFAQMDDIAVAGKTGTAQIRAKGGTLHLAWFVGFAPVDDPKIAISVMIEGTDLLDNYAGGTTAAPVARELLEAYFAKVQKTTELANF